MAVRVTDVGAVVVLRIHPAALHRLAGPKHRAGISHIRARLHDGIRKHEETARILHLPGEQITVGVLRIEPEEAIPHLIGQLFDLAPSAMIVEHRVGAEPVAVFLRGGAHQHFRRDVTAPFFDRIAAVLPPAPGKPGPEITVPGIQRIIAVTDHHSLVVIGIHLLPGHALLEIAHALRRLRLFPRLIQSRKQHPRQDCDDRNHHKYHLLNIHYGNILFNQ